MRSFIEFVVAMLFMCLLILFALTFKDYLVAEPTKQEPIQCECICECPDLLQPTVIQ